MRVIPKQEKSYAERRKEKIILAAREVFVRKGFTEATMKDVLEEAAISRGGLYAHYANIEDLFLAVLKYDDAENMIVMLKEPNNVLIEIEEWLRLIFLSSQKKLTRAKSEYFFKVSSTEIPYITERREYLLEAINHYCIQAEKKGLVPKEVNYQLFSDLLIAWIDGILLEEAKNPSIEEIKIEKIRLLIDILASFLK